MIQTKTSIELKMKAKGLLLGNYGKLITAFLMVQLISTTILFLASDLLNGASIWNDILYYAVYFLDLLFLGIFLLGQSKLYLNFATNRPIGLSDIFYAFQGHQDLGIQIMLVRIVISVVSMIPFGISVVLYRLTDSVILYPIMSILLIAGGVMAIRELLALSQCYMVAVDFPDYNLKQVMNMSKKIMSGQRARLFYLYVSFIPMMLLCLLSFGIGFLWFYPYFYCTQANFYLDLMEYHTRRYAA